MKKPRRADLEAAHRVRAGVIGLLECCRCTYPTEQHDTATRHALECPSHHMTLSAIANGARLYHLTPTEPSK